MIKYPEEVKMDAIERQLRSYELKNLGVANGWTETPFAVEVCRALKHELTGREISNCYHEITCPICNYFYSVDSSG